jgi:hypothetical protein
LCWERSGIKGCPLKSVAYGIDIHTGADAQALSGHVIMRIAPLGNSRNLFELIDDLYGIACYALPVVVTKFTGSNPLRAYFSPIIPLFLAPN